LRTEGRPLSKPSDKEIAIFGPKKDIKNFEPYSFFNFWSSTLDPDPDPVSLGVLDPVSDSIYHDPQQCVYNPSPRCRTWTRKS
jgi:hypothetical protein